MNLEEICSYAPQIRMDDLEHFRIRKIGYRVYTGSGPSDSFRREILLENISRETCMAIEYAYFLDYDIQHLYDLEHIWIYLDHEGRITGTEGSFHGRYLSSTLTLEAGAEKAVLPGRNGLHVIMYSQPGKHAMMPDPQLFYLYPELMGACSTSAGIHGLDAPERFLKGIRISDEENEKVKKYIRTHYSFTPSMHFHETVLSGQQYLPWEELAEQIPGYLQEELTHILQEQKE